MDGSPAEMKATLVNRARLRGARPFVDGGKASGHSAFEFENWAVIALGGIKNKVQVGDMGIDGRIFPVGSEPKAFGSDELGLQERWYPIQVKQKDKAGRPDIDQFAQATRRAKCAKGFCVSFAFSDDALREIQRFFVEEHAIIVPLTVQEILEEQIGMKLV